MSLIYFMHMTLVDDSFENGSLLLVNNNSETTLFKTEFYICNIYHSL